MKTMEHLTTKQIKMYNKITVSTFRAVKMPPIELANPNKNILDGELLWKFLHLSIMEKTEIAKRIGTTVSQVCITAIIGIKHGFLCINICWAPREALKPEPERRGFQPSRGAQEMLMHQKENV